MNFPGLRTGTTPLAILLLLGGCVHAWLYRLYQPDDAFIVLVYVKNLLAGNGLTFNGERVEGFSSTLWTLLVAAVAAPGIDPLRAAKVLSGVAYLCVGLVLLQVPGLVPATRPRAARLCVLAMWFSLAPAALWASGALETTLTALLLLSACCVYFRASCVSHSWRDHVAAGLLFGALGWARPEGIAFLGAIAIFELFRFFGGYRNWRGACITAAMAVGMFALLMAWRRYTYGMWMPATVAAKTGDLASQVLRGRAYLTSFASEYPWLLVAFGAAIVALLVRRGLFAWLALFATIVVAGDTVFVLCAGGDWMIGHRFIVPMIPIAVAMIYLAAERNVVALAIVTSAFAGIGVAKTYVRVQVRNQDGGITAESMRPLPRSMARGDAVEVTAPVPAGESVSVRACVVLWLIKDLDCHTFAAR